MSAVPEITPCSIRLGVATAVFAFDGDAVRLAVTSPEGGGEIALPVETMRKLLEIGWGVCGDADRAPGLHRQPPYHPAGPDPSLARS